MRVFHKSFTYRIVSVNHSNYDIARIGIFLLFNDDNISITNSWFHRITLNAKTKEISSLCKFFSDFFGINNFFDGF